MAPTAISTPAAELPGAADVSVQVADAFAAARAAQSGWAQVPVARRLERVRALRRLIAAEAPRLAAASAQARSRPLAEVLTAEVLPLAEACRFLEREAAALLAPQRLGRARRPAWLAGVRSEIHREPFGVVLIIGPGNYPLLLPGVQLLQALVAGNSVVLKPGAGGSVAAEALLGLCARAGFAPGVTTLLPESTEAARLAVLAHPDKVVFTGSAKVGQSILGQLAPQLIPSTMELSGADAVLVRADANLELTAKALAFGLRLNAGATCLAPRRVFVARSVAGELERRLKALLEEAGPAAVPTLPRSSRGNEAHTGKFQGADQSLVTSAATIIAEALELGARVLVGEVMKDGTLALPLVLAGVSPRARLLREDLFLPILALVEVMDDFEAVRRANAGPFALGASVFSRNEAAARALALELNAGVVTINDLIIPTADPRLPFGGRQRSGFGVTRGAEGFLALTRPKVVATSRGRFRPAYEPAHPVDEELFTAYLQLAHGRGWRRRWRALVALGRGLARKRKTLGAVS